MMNKCFLFVTANTIETKALLEDKTFFHYKPDQRSNNPDDDSFYNVGRFGEYAIVHFELQDQGTVKSGASLTSISLAIDYWKPDAVILLGIAFGRDNESMGEPRQHIGDVLVSTMIADYESGKVKDGKVLSDAPIPESGKSLIATFRHYAKTWDYKIDGRKAECDFGLVLSGDKVVDNAKFKKQLFDAYPRARGGEMEGRGAYSACRTKRLEEWIVIKAICDWGENKDSPDKDDTQLLAAKSVVSLLKHVFSKRVAFEKLPKRSYNIKCSFDFDDFFRLDDSFLSNDEISTIEQSFGCGYKIIALRGDPGCGKSYIARTFANTHKTEYPIAKALRVKKTSDEQLLGELVISALHFDTATIDKCSSKTKEEQFYVKLAAFNEVSWNKLIIISCPISITEADIESLLELNAFIILCTQSRIIAHTVNDIPVKPISQRNAIDMFRYYYDLGVNDQLLCAAFKMIEYHVGTIIFMAKLMKYHTLTLSAVMSKFDSPDFNNFLIPTDAGTKMTSLAQYHCKLFSFEKLSTEEEALLLLFAILPPKSYSVTFLKESFTDFDFNCVISLSLRGYVDYDQTSSMVKCSALICKTFLASQVIAVDEINKILSSIISILEYDDCKEFSEIEDKITFGVNFIEMIGSRMTIDRELYLRIAKGYQLLCLFNDAQRYADIASINANKDVAVSVINLKTEIMIFCFDYQSSIDLLESFIKDTIWSELSTKEQAELFYKSGLVYSFIGSDKSLYYLKRSFTLFENAGIIGGELAALTQMILIAKSKKEIAYELRAFNRDSKRLLKKEPLWSLSSIGYKFFCKLLLGNYDEIYYGTIYDLLNSMRFGWIKQKLYNIEAKKVFNVIKGAANDGAALAFYRFYEYLEHNITRATEELINYCSEFLKTMNTINIPMATEINVLNSIIKFFPRELEIIDKRVIIAAIIKLFEERFSHLLPTTSDKLLASQAYAEMLISINSIESAIELLNQQIDTLTNYLPPESRYPLVSMYETLAYCYSVLQKNNSSRSDSLKFMKKEYASLKAAYDIVFTIPNAYLKQATLLYHFNAYDSAIELLEHRKCINCTLCHCYYQKALQIKDEEELLKFYIKKMFSVQKQIKLCGASCYAEKLYGIGNVYSNTKKPRYYYHALSFLVDKKNKKSTSISASDNCFILSNFFYRKRLRRVANYLLRWSVKFAIKGRNDSALRNAFQIYFSRANIVSEAKVFKRELLANGSKLINNNFSNMAKYHYGKKDVSVTEISQLLFDEIDDRVQQLTSSNSKGISELQLIGLSNTIDVAEWWYMPIKWDVITKDFRSIFFFGLLFNFREYGFLNTTLSDSMFLKLYCLAAELEELLCKRNICKAEDLLYEFMDNNKEENLLPIYSYFYYRLGQFSDVELLMANFSREEIADGLTVAEQRYSQGKKFSLPCVEQ